MTAATIEVTEPGVFDIPVDAYHADPVPAQLGGSLSTSGAKLLLPPSCPARYRWATDHPEPPAASRVFDVGTAAHRLVLGAGPDLVRIDADKWLSKAVKAEVAAVRAAGAVPLKPAEFEQVHAMAAALRRHPIAAALLAAGIPEQSLFWVDPETGVWRRARIDWLPDATSRRRIVIPDYKSCESASPEELRRAIYNYGYHLQAAAYIDAAQAVGHAADAAFVLIAQEKTPPYLVTVVQPDPAAVDIGRDQNRRALELYAECTGTGRWPGYTDDVAEIALPGWVERRHFEETW